MYLVTSPSECTSMSTASNSARSISLPYNRSSEDRCEGGIRPIFANSPLCFSSSAVVAVPKISSSVPAAFSNARLAFSPADLSSWPSCKTFELFIHDQLQRNARTQKCCKEHGES